MENGNDIPIYTNPKEEGVTDVKKLCTTLSPEAVFEKIKEVASKYPKGQKFYLDEVYELISTDICENRMKFVEYLHSIHYELKGLVISYRGIGRPEDNFGNCTSLFLD